MNKILKSVHTKLMTAKTSDEWGLSNRDNEDLKYFTSHKYRLAYLFRICRKHFKPGKSFLDIGSSYGLASLGARLIGYESVHYDGNKSGEEFIIPFPAGKFDLIFVSETMEQTNLDPARFLTEVARVLKSGGLLIVTTPNLLRLNNASKLMLGHSLFRKEGSKFRDTKPYREFSAGEVAYLVKSSGLAVKKVQYRNFDYHDLSFSLRLLNKIGGVVFPHRKGNLVITARKKN